MGMRDEMLVYADELEQAGDMRSELVRAEAEGRDGAALITENWADLLGRVDPQHVLCQWSWGQLLDLGIGAAPALWTVRELLDHPTTEGLVRLSLGPGVSSRGVEFLDELSVLVCLGGRLEARALKVQALMVALPNGGYQDLAGLEAPRLQTLHTRCPGRDEAALIRTVASASWFSSLRRWRHRPASLDGVLALLDQRPVVVRGGEGLVLLCEAPVLAALPAHVRQALPLASFVLLPTCARPYDPEDTFGPVALNVVPRAAPMHFRSLPPTTTTRKPSGQSEDPEVTSVGSGFASSNGFETCGWCGSPDTRTIWETSWSLYSHFETTRYRRWEYECQVCGLFNFMTSTRTS